MKRIRSMKGIEIYETSDGIERVGIVYYSNKGALREMVGDVTSDPAACGAVELIRLRKRLKGKYRDCRVCIEAVRRVDERRAAVKEAKRAGRPYLTPKEQAQAEASALADAEKALAPMTYEEVCKRFLTHRGGFYARPDDVRLRLAIIGRAFNGRRMDTLAKSDVRQYVRDRTNRTGPFADWPHAVGLRPAQMDVTQLSAVYGFLIDDEEREIENPCSRYRSRASRTKAEVYRPKRKAVVPSDDQVRVIFDAATRREGDRYSTHLPGEAVRAFVKLCYYTGARPESDACKLTHGAVMLSDPDVLTLEGKTRLGRVRFVDAKTAAGDRELPIHPELDADLRAVMLPLPDDPAKLDAWKATPIFRRRMKLGATVAKEWDKSSYQKAWDAIIDRVKGDNPSLAGMIVRDFRKVARTKMTNHGTPEPVIRWFMGHARNVSQTYCEITDAAAESAVNALTLAPPTKSDVRSAIRSSAV